MPERLSFAQIRAARAMLDWSMVDLAKAASVSVSTIKRMESGAPQPLSDDMWLAVRQALEASRIRFLSNYDGGEGVWRDHG